MTKSKMKWRSGRWRSDPVLRALPYTDALAPWRRLACAVLVDGALGAHAGDESDRAWLSSDQAQLLADLVGLEGWPPAPAQLGGFTQLRARAAAAGREARHWRLEANPWWSPGMPADG